MEKNPLVLLISEVTNWQMASHITLPHLSLLHACTLFNSHSNIQEET